MPRDPDWETLAQQAPLLATLPKYARHAARALELRRGARLFLRGDTPTAMYAVLDGEVHLLRRSESGSEVIFQRARSGIVAEASLHHGSYHCDALAVAPSRVLAIPRASFKAALGDDRFRDAWIAHLSRELRRVRAQSERLSLKSARDRVVHYLESEGQDGSLTLTTSKKDWAAELGLTHETLYRTLARMQRTRQLRIDGSTLRLLD